MDALQIPTLITERLRLRAFRGGDFEDYAALRSDREVLRYLDCGPEPWDRGRSWRHMAFLMGHWQLAGCGMWALEQRETGAFLGFAGFAAPTGWPGFELAWTLARRWWGMATPPKPREPPSPMPSPSGARTASSASSTRRTGPPSASPSASARDCKAISSISTGRCCAMASTGRATPASGGKSGTKSSWRVEMPGVFVLPGRCGADSSLLTRGPDGSPRGSSA